MTCQEVDELIPAYVLGALPSEERQQVHVHLADCPEHAMVLERHRVVAGALSLAPEDTAPSASLRARVLAAVHDDPPAMLLAAASSRISLQPFRPIYAAAAILVIGLLVWNLLLQFGGGESEAFVRYLGNDRDDEAHAWVYFVEGVGVITAEGLAQLPPDMSYKAWVETDGKVVGLGTIDASVDGDGFILLETHVAQDQRVFITVEAASSGSEPSGSLVVWTRD